MLTSVLNDLSHFVLSIPIIAAMMAWYRVVPRWDCLWIFPLLLVAQLSFTFGLSLLSATCNIFLRDLERLIGILTMLWFYLTPILFVESWVPQRYQWTNYANPMAAMVISWRHIFMGLPPEPMALAAAVLWGAAVSAIAYFLFQRLNWRFAELV